MAIPNHYECLWAIKSVSACSFWFVSFGLSAPLRTGVFSPPRDDLPRLPVPEPFGQFC